MKPGTKAESGKRIGNLPERLGEPLEVQMLIRLTVICTMCAHEHSVVSDLATPHTRPTGSSVHTISQAKILEWEVEKRFKREGTYAYLQLIHVDVWQKNPTTQYCKSIILQLKISKLRIIKKTGVCCHLLPQVIFPSQGLNPSLLGLLHWQAGSYELSYQSSPVGTTVLSNLPKCPSARLLGKEALGPAYQPAKQ